MESILLKSGVDITTVAANARQPKRGGVLQAGPNSEALSIIRTSVSREIIPIISGEKDAFKTWIILENRFAAIDLEARWEKLLKLLSIRKVESDSICVYCSKVRELFNDLNQYSVKQQGGGNFLPDEILIAAIINGLPQELKESVIRLPKKDLTFDTICTRLTFS